MSSGPRVLFTAVKRLPLTITLLLIVALLIGIFLSGAVSRNLLRLSIYHAWLSWEPENMGNNDALHDGIPDEWNAHWWGGATGIYRLEEQGAFAGNRAASIEHTNQTGSTTLVQHVAVEPGLRLVCSVYAEGAAGAIQIQFRGEKTAGWTGGERLGAPASDAWQQHRLSASVPSGVYEARLLLYGTEQTLFDDAYVGIESNEYLSPNLLRNAGFEQDGISENPLIWWQQNTDLVGSPELYRDQILEDLVYLNTSDMLAGRYDAIKLRARKLGKSCVSIPEMTGWLTAYGDEFEQRGGPAARERLYQLAIELAPNCPQPYAELASLYESYNAFWRAAELYRQAAELAGEAAQAGKYYFAEGRVRLKYTGEGERAVFALQRAEQLNGWEANYWEWGAASFFLGEALEKEGRLDKAVAAYRRVLECNKCSYHHATARDRLKALSVRVEEQ